MATVNLGRVAYVEKGAYNGTDTYQKKDVVFYSGGSYVFIGETPAAGIEPNNTAYWMPMLQTHLNGMELIETITLAEETSAIVRTAEPDGTAYNFKSMFVSAITPQSAAAGIVYFRINNASFAPAPSSIQTNEKGGIAHMFVDASSGFLDGFGAGARNASTSGGLERYLLANNAAYLYDKVTKLQINSTVAMPIGTVINIYGVRA